MKILNVNISIDSLLDGGTAERTYQMSRFLVRNNMDCAILTLSAKLSTEKLANLQGVEIISLPYLWKRFHIPKFSLRRIKKLVQEVDIIHLMNHWTLLNAVVYYYARRCNKPYVFCPAGALLISGRSKALKKIYNWLIGNKIVRNANVNIAVAINEFEHFKQYGIDAKQVTLIPNGVHHDDLTYSSESLEHLNLKIPQQNFILFMGRLNSLKGPDLLLRAFANTAKENNTYHLIYAGPDAGMLDNLKNMATELGIANRVHFVGAVSGPNKAYVYDKASFLVVPSRQEAMSIVVLEAGILGKPALITDQCGFNEVQQIHGGKVVPATVEGLQAGLKQLMLEPLQLNEMGQNLKNHIMQNYTWDIIVQKIISIYKQIL